MGPSRSFDHHHLIPRPLAEQMWMDRQFGHRMVMADLPAGLGQSPRSAAGVLWQVDPKVGSLVVRTRVAPEGTAGFGSPQAIVPVPEVPVGATVSFAVTRTCQFTPSAAIPVELRPQLKAHGSYRSRLTIVPEADRPSWAVRRMAAAGLEVDPAALQISALGHATARKQRFPMVTVSGSATVTDSDALTAALTGGIGRGKNYGLGLLMSTVTAVS